MKRIRTRGINEISIKLLPEKAKRDYLLRLVSSIIFLVFVIVNFLVIYIPLTGYRSDLNELKRQNAEKNLQTLALQHKYDFFYQDIYNNNDGTVLDIIDSKIDIMQIMNLFKHNQSYISVHDNLPITESQKQENTLPLLPKDSKVEVIQYSEAELSFSVTIQFKDFKDLTNYQNQLNRIKYISSVVVGSYTPVPIEGEHDQVKTSFKITILPGQENCPKVGD